MLPLPPLLLLLLLFLLLLPKPKLHPFLRDDLRSTRATRPVHVAIFLDMIDMAALAHQTRGLIHGR